MNAQDIAEAAQTYHRQYREAGSTVWEDSGVTPELVDKFLLGQIVHPMSLDHSRWQGMIVAPYISAQGRVVTLRVTPFQFDRLDQPTKVTLETVWPEPRPHLFNVGNALPGLRTDRVVIVHHVQDVLLLRGLGYRTVGAPGSYWDEAWGLLFDHSRVVHVVPPVAADVNWERYWRDRKVNHRVVPIESENLADQRLSKDDIINLLGVAP